MTRIIIIIMPENSYKGTCFKHGIPICNFCPDCLTFLCYECKDPHIGRIIPNWLLDDYLKALCLQGESKEGKKSSNLKGVIIKTYEEMLKIMAQSLNTVCKLIDIHADGSSTIIDNIQKLKLNDSALQALRALAKEHKENILAEGDNAIKEYTEFFNEACEDTMSTFSKINMETDYKISGHTQSLATSTKCNNHSNQDAKFYCKKHNIWYCDKCIKVHKLSLIHI